MFRYGVENLLKNQRLIKELRGHRVGLVAHPASLDQDLRPSLELLAKVLGPKLTCGFGPQHGIRGEKQDNMIESDDVMDHKLKIPIFSLYGHVRRPTPEMMDHFDVLLFDLQDLGCRIYTFLTTLFYLVEDCAKFKKSLWVLDRPNPVGRPIEGSLLTPEFHSFVGIAPIPMRHGLTLGEAALWYAKHKNLALDLRVIKMTGYNPEKTSEWGWPKHLPWVNPSPNAPNLSMARAYPGSVMVVGLNASEGRGTTRPLELMGLPDIDPDQWIQHTDGLHKGRLKGFHLRPMFFEPTFHKFKGQLCGGVQVHVDDRFYQHKDFKPYRLFACLFKALHQIKPDFDLWKQPPYEYELEKLPIDLISGSTFLRTWIEDPKATFSDLNAHLAKDERQWAKESRTLRLY